MSEIPEPALDTGNKEIVVVTFLKTEDGFVPISVAEGKVNASEEVPRTPLLWKLTALGLLFFFIMGLFSFLPKDSSNPPEETERRELSR